MFNKVLGYNLLIRHRVQLYLYSGINGDFGLVNSKSIGTRALFVPFSPTPSHTFKPNWAGPKG